jgi:hypothetical protein
MTRPSLAPRRSSGERAAAERALKERAARSATDKRLEDAARQYRLYRAAKRQQYEDLFADPVHGEQLRKFRATLNHFGLGDAKRMIAFVADSNYAWLRNAPPDIRHAALEMVDARIQRIRIRAGMPVFSDPLPHQPDDVFQICKKELA